MDSKAAAQPMEEEEQPQQNAANANGTNANGTNSKLNAPLEADGGLLLQQIQAGITAFWLLQQQQLPAVPTTSSSSSGIFPAYPSVYSPSSALLSMMMMPTAAAAPVAAASVSPMPTLQPECPQQETTTIEKEEEPTECKEDGKIVGTRQATKITGCTTEQMRSNANVDMEKTKVQIPGREEKAVNNNNNNNNNNKKSSGSSTGTGGCAATSIVVRPPMLDKHWQYVTDVQSFVEFEQLRCVHQVSRNRTFAYGIRYSCTQKTQLRCNCPYLLVCIFADGAGEHTAPGVGKISVFSRNAHTHPVKTIKRRLPRSLARQAKREREELKMKMKADATQQQQQQQVETLKTTNTTIISPAINATAKNNNNNVMNLLAELSEHFALSSKAKNNEEDMKE